MNTIWLRVIWKYTLEENHLAYKKARDMQYYVGETLEVTHRLRPLYNFKAVD